MDSQDNAHVGAPVPPPLASPIHNGIPGTVPLGPFPRGFTPIVLPEPRLDSRGRHRPRTAPVSVTKVRFEGEADLRLKRTLEAMAALRGITINDLYLRLLRLGALTDLESRKAQSKPPTEP